MRAAERRSHGWPLKGGARAAGGGLPRHARGATIPLTLVQDGERVMRICNACRYCEGFCAVFPAIERRLVFAEADLVYLANLCHNCGECLYSCQYAPPHEFAVNVPRLLSTIRQETFRKYAWPGIFAGLFTRNGLMLLASAVFVPALCCWPSSCSRNPRMCSRRIRIGKAPFTAWCPTASWPACSACSRS